MPQRSECLYRTCPRSSCERMSHISLYYANSICSKPPTCLAGPWPDPTVLPKITQKDDCGDYEAELVVVLGKKAKNVSEAEAMDYVLGYTAANDVSSRSSQFAQSQWSYSKGFDGACPIGKTIPTKFHDCRLTSSRSYSCLALVDPRPEQTPHAGTEEWRSPAGERCRVCASKQPRFGTLLT